MPHCSFHHSLPYHAQSRNFSCLPSSFIIPLRSPPRSRVVRYRRSRSLTLTAHAISAPVVPPSLEELMHGTTFQFVQGRSYRAKHLGPSLCGGRERHGAMPCCTARSQRRMPTCRAARALTRVCHTDIARHVLFPRPSQSPSLNV